eukprot:1658181-Prymnesium_polylepis.1
MAPATTSPALARTPRRRNAAQGARVARGPFRPPTPARGLRGIAMPCRPVSHPQQSISKSRADRARLRRGSMCRSAWPSRIHPEKRARYSAPPIGGFARGVSWALWHRRREHRRAERLHACHRRDGRQRLADAVRGVDRH